MAMRFTENCHKLGLWSIVDFIVACRARPLDSAQSIDLQDWTVKHSVSLGHAIRTGFYGTPRLTAWLTSIGMRDTGHASTDAVYPGLSRELWNAWSDFITKLFPSQSCMALSVTKAIKNNDLRGLYKEAREFWPLAQAQTVHQGIIRPRCLCRGRGKAFRKWLPSGQCPSAPILTSLPDV